MRNKRKELCQHTQKEDNLSRNSLKKLMGALAFEAPNVSAHYHNKMIFIKYVRDIEDTVQ